MAVVVSAAFAAKVKSLSLPRINDAQTPQEALATACVRLDALHLIGENHITRGIQIKGVIPSGGATAKVLYGKSGTSKGHKVLRSNVAFATKEQIESFKKELTQFAVSETVEEIKARYFRLMDSVNVPMTVWEDSPCWGLLNNRRVTFSAFAVVQAVNTENGVENRVVLDVEPEDGQKFEVDDIPRRGNISLGIPDTTSTPVAEMVNIGGNIMTVADARTVWAKNNPLAGEPDWQAVLATLPKA